MKHLIKNFKIFLYKGEDIIEYNEPKYFPDMHWVVRDPDFHKRVAEVIENPPYDTSFFENYFLQSYKWTPENQRIIDKLNNTDIEDIMRFIEYDPSTFGYTITNIKGDAFYEDIEDIGYEAHVDIYVYWEELLEYIGE
jgi:hypothetical protein